MDLDPDRWRALLDAERDAQEAMPQFITVQNSQARLGLARATLANFKARGPVSRSLPRAAHAGERILADTMGSHGPDDIAKAFESSVRELEARVAAAEHDAKRIELRHRQCADRLAGLHRLVEACRTWAAEQGVVLPGEDVRIVPPTGLPGGRSVHTAGPAPGAIDFLARSA